MSEQLVKNKFGAKKAKKSKEDFPTHNSEDEHLNDSKGFMSTNLERKKRKQSFFEKIKKQVKANSSAIGIDSGASHIVTFLF